MGAARLFGGPGWRRTAMINTVLVAALTLTLVVLVGIVSARSGSVFSNLTFHAGNCDSASRLNLLLHLVINIISTGIIASSNFFIQVLNAPSRAEVDAAHAKHKILRIGVQSTRNLFYVSWFKVVSAGVFILSSVPIHLLFNSAVFETEVQRRDWQMILAAEPFLHNGAYAVPGAYLAPSGFWPAYPISDRELGEIRRFADIGRDGYGGAVNLTEYRNASSPVVRNITRAAGTASGWARLDPSTCRQQYISCEPRSRYGNVVVVLNTRGESNTTGWTRDEVFADMTDADAEFWDGMGVSATAPNSLWWSGQCAVEKDPTADADECSNTCGEFIGGSSDYYGDVTEFRPSVGSTDLNWTISNSHPMEIRSNFTGPSFPWTRNATLALQHRTGFGFAAFGKVDVRYCLAEEIADQCRVGVSGIILLAVTLCAALKTAQCFVVLLRLREDPLVTPGDAVASFLVDPDTESRDMCAVGSPEYIAWRSKKKENPVALHGPRRWTRSPRFLWSAIPMRTWLANYVVFLAALLLAGWLFSNAMPHHTPGVVVKTTQTYSGFDRSLQNGLFDAWWVPWGRFLPSIIVANLAQLALTLCYFIYNSIWTRLHAELEWNTFALDYRPLRVSSPKGQQTSTYRLQLPYLYGIPLIVGSIFLHWLVSNAIYIVVVEGDFLNDKNFMTEDSMGFSKNTYINIGYSTGPILVGIIACSVTVALPLIFSFIRRLKGDMPVASNNSLIIAAGCHTSSSPIDRPPTPPTPPTPGRPGDGLAETEELIPQNREPKRPDGEYDGLRDGKELVKRIAISEGRLRWGVVSAKERLHEIYRGHQVPVGHLAFGGEDEHVTPPERGSWYA